MLASGAGARYNSAVTMQSWTWPRRAAAAALAGALAMAPLARAQERVTGAPTGWDAVEARAFALLDAGKPTEAIAVVDATLQREPLFASGHYTLGELLLSASGVRTSSGDPLPPVQRAWLERAVMHYERASALDRGLEPAVLPTLALIYAPRGLDRGPAREQVLRVLVERQPGVAVWHIDLADAVARQGRWPDAAQVLMTSLTRMPDAERVAHGVLIAHSVQAWTTMPQAESRRVLEAVDAVAGQVVAATPDAHDAWMLRAGALHILAERLPSGPERDRVRATSADALVRARALMPR